MRTRLWTQVGQHCTVPPLLLRALTLTSLVVKELLEMQYQLEEPFIVDSSKITTRLGVPATPLNQALAETFNSYTNPSHPRPERAR
ncbi:hypothetical protein QF038_001961 [Pseudarthrobacter sp. W1I19]|uniref:hypothetical protein n=1 Tax=Pseudarthrobacter sp. W1I19 TaxID=3042288 RepID=UPI00277D73E3|nr:hypothetical protein [Pseudarthrobacter sp. W1I19]MDQ0923453.1 hypothetical protein [Pseudarthrobacter sp. W1I19]